MIEYLILERKVTIQEVEQLLGTRFERVDHGWVGWDEPIPDAELQEGLNRLGQDRWLLVGPLNSDRLIFRRRRVTG